MASNHVSGFPLKSLAKIDTGFWDLPVLQRALHPVMSWKWLTLTKAISKLSSAQGMYVYRSSMTEIKSSLLRSLGSALKLWADGWMEATTRKMPICSFTLFLSAPASQQSKLHSISFQRPSSLSHGCTGMFMRRMDPHSTGG